MGSRHTNTLRSQDPRRTAMSKFNPHPWLIVFPIAALLGDLLPAAAAPQAPLVSAPAAFDVADRAAVLVVHATGAQIYEC